jgi:hypothetical protein
MTQRIFAVDFAGFARRLKGAGGQQLAFTGIAMGDAN